MRLAIVIPTVLAVLLAGCPRKTIFPDDDTSADDDTTEEGPFVGIPASLPDASLYEAYSERLLPDGFATPPLQWYLIGGALPEGLAMDGDGYVTGTPSERGLFELEIYVVDGEGVEGSGTVELAVRVDWSQMYLGIWIEEVDPLCTKMEFLCLPWVRIEGTGEEQYERQLHPAWYHVGPDGNVDDGHDDDVLHELLDPASFSWSWTPLEWPTGDESILYPEDAVIDDGGLMVGGELTGAGTVEYTHPTLGGGSAMGYVVAPDWCPDWGC